MIEDRLQNLLLLSQFVLDPLALGDLPPQTFIDRCQRAGSLHHAMFEFINRRPVSFERLFRRTYFDALPIPVPQCDCVTVNTHRIEELRPATFREREITQTKDAMIRHCSADLALKFAKVPAVLLQSGRAASAPHSGEAPG